MIRTLIFGLLLGLQLHPARAWDYEGHRAVNQLALATLPTNFPAFALTSAARERIAYLAGEPDRWRNTDDLSLAHANGPDHYLDLDLDQLADYGLTPSALPIFRYDFTAQLALARAAHPGKFASVEAAKNKDHTRELVGFLPWAVVEYQARLKSGFASLKTLQNHGGTADEIANAQANILYIMGVMGHYVGDGSQPLHVTRHHHGWVGKNPRGYATNFSFHAWIDGGCFRKSGGIQVGTLAGRMRPAKLIGDPFRSDDLFRQVMGYLGGTARLVEPLYQLEKDAKLSPPDEGTQWGQAFLEAQLVRGGQMLGDLWFTAWQQAGEDKYLMRQLNEQAASQR